MTARSVVFRVDSSSLIGSGHLERCLTLADRLRRHGLLSTFVCRELPGHRTAAVTNRGFDLRLLPTPTSGQPVEANQASHPWLGVTWQEDADQTRAAVADVLPPVAWLVVDHYGLGAHWEAAVSGSGLRLLVIDDLYDRMHACDLLLNQNLALGPAADYSGLVPDTCTLLLGPRYALLRQEFADWRARVRERDGEVRRLLLSFGGVDAPDMTSRALLALRDLEPEDLVIDVVVGAGYAHHAPLLELAATVPGAGVHRAVSNMAELLAAADLALGAGGASTWERAALGVPSLTVAIADNQSRVSQLAADHGLSLYLGWHEEVSTDVLASAIEGCRRMPHVLREMSRRGLGLVDGDGASRVSALLATS